jgi:hypothetical protein
MAMNAWLRGAAGPVRHPRLFRHRRYSQSRAVVPHPHRRLRWPRCQQLVHAETSASLGVQLADGMHPHQYGEFASPCPRGAGTLWNAGGQ